MNWQSILSVSISIIALFLGVYNLIVTIKNHKRNREIQNRNDKIQIDNLLDKAFDCLYGKNGYAKTKERDKFYEAESQVLRAKEIDKNYSRVVEYEGICFEAQGNKIKAIEKYQEALALKPERWTLYDSLGRLSEGERAISYFQSAIKINPEKAGIPYYNMGKCYLKMSEMWYAKLAFQKCLEYLPNYHFAHYELANIFKKEDDYVNARGSYEKAISCNPNYIDAQVNLGAMLCEKLDWEEGVSWIESAIKIDPTDSFPIAMLAALYADKGDHENALKYNEKAIEMDLTRKISTDSSQELKKAMLELKKSKDNTSE